MVQVSAGTLLSKLQEVSQTIPNPRARNPMPFAIFDIDGTLLDPFPRHVAVYEEVLQHKFKLPPVHELDLRSKPYFIGDLIPELKKKPMKYKQVADTFLEHFLSPEYLHLDQPYPGAINFLNEIRKLDIGILYLTSRHLNGARSMADKTIEIMGDLGFPIRPSADVLFSFKSHLSDDDFEFKEKFAQKFKANKFQSCMFFADNETKMCEIFRKEFPSTIVTRFATAQSEEKIFDGFTLNSWDI